MKKIILLMLSVVVCCQASAKTQEKDNISEFNDKYVDLEQRQAKLATNLAELSKKQEATEIYIQELSKDKDRQQLLIDSLQNQCKQLESAQSSDRKNIGGMIDRTNSDVQANQETLQSRTIWIGVMVLLLFIVIISVSYRLAKRIKSGNTSIVDVRKAQEALQAAQTKMQEESVKLDNQLLAIVQKQLDASVSQSNKATGEPDHSLVVKLADEIARIETNLSKMDKSVRGYKQLVQAKDRMINNVRANGYEIISLLGQEYNDGMQFPARFVPDESLPEGKRIITGMIKMQVNYNGKMIQPAEIVVSQNI